MPRSRECGLKGQGSKSSCGRTPGGHTHVRRHGPSLGAGEGPAPLLSCPGDTRDAATGLWSSPGDVLTRDTAGDLLRHGRTCLWGMLAEARPPSGITDPLFQFPLRRPWVLEKPLPKAEARTQVVHGGLWPSQEPVMYWALLPSSGKCAKWTAPRWLL